MKIQNSSGYSGGSKRIQTPKLNIQPKTYGEMDINFLISSLTDSYEKKRFNDDDLIELYQVLPLITEQTPFPSKLDSMFMGEIVRVLGSLMELRKIKLEELNHLRLGVEDIMKNSTQKIPKVKVIKPQIEGLSKNHNKNTKKTKTPQTPQVSKIYSNEDMKRLSLKVNKLYIDGEVDDDFCIELYLSLFVISKINPYPYKLNESVNTFITILGEYLEQDKITKVQIDYFKNEIELIMRNIYQKEYKPQPLRPKLEGFSKGYNNNTEIKRYGR